MLPQEADAPPDGPTLRRGRPPSMLVQRLLSSTGEQGLGAPPSENGFDVADDATKAPPPPVLLSAGSRRIPSRGATVNGWCARAPLPPRLARTIIACCLLTGAARRGAAQGQGEDGCDRLRRAERGDQAAAEHGEERRVQQARRRACARHEARAVREQAGQGRALRHAEPSRLRVGFRLLRARREARPEPVLDRHADEGPDRSHARAPRQVRPDGAPPRLPSRAHTRGGAFYSRSFVVLLLARAQGTGTPLLAPWVEKILSQYFGPRSLLRRGWPPLRLLLITYTVARARRSRRRAHARTGLPALSSTADPPPQRDPTCRAPLCTARAVGRAVPAGAAHGLRPAGDHRQRGVRAGRGSAADVRAGGRRGRGARRCGAAAVPDAAHVRAGADGH